MPSVPAVLNRNRLAKILGRLGSDHDGEIAAAGRLATAELARLKLTWLDVLVTPDEKPSRLELQERIVQLTGQLAAMGRRLEAADQLAAALREGIEIREGLMKELVERLNAGNGLTDRRRFDLALERLDDMDESDERFVRSVRKGYVEWGRLTEKQRTVLDRILRKYNLL